MVGEYVSQIELQFYGERRLTGALSHHLSVRGSVRQAVVMDLALGNTDRMS